MTTTPAVPEDGTVLSLAGVGFEHVGRRRRVRAVDDFSLAVRTGEHVALLGPSGSGKSTILDLACGLRRPSTGAGHLLGRDLSTSPAAALAHVRLHHVARIYQDFQLLPRLSGLDNVAITPRLQGVPKEESRERAREALAAVSMGHRADHRPGELSGGEQQRIAIARALVTTPDLLLADEPTGSLDSALRDEIIDLVLDVLGGAAIILVTHDESIAGRMERVVRALPPG